MAVTAVLMVSFIFPLGLTAQSTDAPPDWAYPMNPPGFKAAPDDGTLRRVPGSSATYTLSQARNLFAAPDWHPQDHAAMPRGRIKWQEARCASMRSLSPRRRDGRTREFQPRRTSGGLHRATDARLQERRTENVRS